MNDTNDESFMSRRSDKEKKELKQAEYVAKPDHLMTKEDIALLKEKI